MVKIFYFTLIFIRKAFRYRRNYIIISLINLKNKLLNVKKKILNDFY